MILFRNPRGLDDKAMSSVLRDVDRRTQALILTDDVAAVERYGKLVEDLGVSQTPSVVIIDRKGRARLIEGYRGTTHSGSLSGVGCVDNRIAQYLLTGAVPARKTGRTSDVRCPKVPAPPVSSARTVNGAGLPSWVRERLMGAQANSLRG